MQLKFKRVGQKINDGKNKGLYRLAGLIRTTAKRSMRKKAGPSRAGSPPHAHVSNGLRVINFVVDKAASAALIGPLKFNGSNFLNEPAPHIQEFGGLFYHGRVFHFYPSRSYMHWTILKLKREGKLLRGFAVSLGTEL